MMEFVLKLMVFIINRYMHTGRLHTRLGDGYLGWPEGSEHSIENAENIDLDIRKYII